MPEVKSGSTLSGLQHGPNYRTTSFNQSESILFHMTGLPYGEVAARNKILLPVEKRRL